MLLSCLATPMWLSGASHAASVGVRMISAPSASRTTCFSRLIFSGIVMTIRYPYTAAASAMPIPVLPLVGSISVSPGWMRPFSCASSTMRLPMRSFTEPPALRYSHLASSSQPVSGPMLRNRTMGVEPMASRMESRILGTRSPGRRGWLGAGPGHSRVRRRRDDARRRAGSFREGRAGPRARRAALRLAPRAPRGRVGVPSRARISTGATGTSRSRPTRCPGTAGRGDAGRSSAPRADDPRTRRSRTIPRECRSAAGVAGRHRREADRCRRLRGWRPCALPRQRRACEDPSVAQKTLVVQVPPADRERLQARLERGVFEHRSVPHAVFSVKGEGAVATLYLSGKLVVQGEDPAIFVERFLGPSAPAAAAKAGSEVDVDARDDEATIGSDECGKGDYFGPLIVAAVRLEPGEARKLRASGVRDSKTLSDETALRLGGA